jgi:ELWxxDGT repeat protein
MQLRTEGIYPMVFARRCSIGQSILGRRSHRDGLTSKHLSFDELESRLALSASSLILDVNTISAGSLPNRFISTGEQVFFAANDGIHGQELWRTDGTEIGTQLVRDLTEGFESSRFPLAANLNGNLVFIKSTLNGSSLWISDGTLAGTTPLAEGVISWEAYSSDSPLAGGVVLDNVLYFLAYRSNEAPAIWRTDGTVDGTWAIDATQGLSPEKLFVFDDKIFFAGRPSGGPLELWATDGTSEGTARVNRTPLSSTGVTIGSFAELNGQLYFTVINNLVPNVGGIWRTDGTADGTVQIYASASTVFPYVEPQLVSYDGLLYFNASVRFGFGGVPPITVLWTIDGDGTNAVAVTSSNGEYIYSARSLTKSHGLLFFTATSPSGTELWRTDGTSSGTFAPNDPTPGANNSTAPGFLTSIGDRLYFTTDRPGTSTATRISSVWTSDGTNTGTVQLYSVPAAIFPPATSDTRPLVGLSNGQVIFMGQNAVDGTEPWVTDGTVDGTRMIRNVNDLTGDGVGSGVAVGKLIYFTATAPGGEVLSQLWVTDGTSQGTRKVDFQLPNGDPINPKQLSSVDGKLVFINRRLTASGIPQEFLIVSDGTTNGTTIIFEGTELSLYDRYMIPGVGPSRLSFSGMASDGRSGFWFTDLTLTGTFHWANFAPTNSQLEFQPGYVTVNGFTYFIVRFNQSAYESTFQLWRTDGTRDGTTKASSADYLFPTSSGISVNQLQVIGDKIYFFGHDGLNANIFETDGTVAGTRVVFQTQQTRFFSKLQNLTAFQGALYFTFASSPTRTDQLWRADVESEQGTLIADLDNLSGFTAAGNKLYFTYSWGDTVQLGLTDGTSKGTRLLSQRYGRINFGGIAAKMDVRGLLVFTTDDSKGQHRILISDGTDEGTYPLVDLFPIYGRQFQSTGPVRAYHLFHIRNRIVYAKKDYQFGLELHRIDFIPPKLIVAGPGITAPNDLSDFTLLVKDLADQSSDRIYTFEIDWNGDGQVDETLTGPNGTVARHQFVDEGQFLVRFSVKTPEGVVGQTIEKMIRSSRELQIEIVNLPVEVVSSEEVPITVEVRGDLVTSSGPILVGIDVNEDNVYDFFTLVQGRRATATIAIPLPTLNPNSGVQDAVRHLRVMASTTAGVVSTNQEVLVKRMRREFKNGEWTFTVGAGVNDVSVEARVDELNRATFVVTDRRGLTRNTGSDNQLAGNLIIYGGSNSNRIDVSTYSRNTTIYGGAGSDTIIGSAQADLIYGDGLKVDSGDQNGNDWIDGRGGDDSIVGDGAEGSQSRHLGADIIFGGEGNDTIYGDETIMDGGEGGNDLLYGDNGNDSIDARSGSDTAYGGEGQDTIVGGADSDLVTFTNAKSGGEGRNMAIPFSAITSAVVIPQVAHGSFTSACYTQDALLTDIALSSWNTKERSERDIEMDEESSLELWEISLEQIPMKHGATSDGRRIV